MWKVSNALEFLQGIADKNPGSFEVAKRPFTLDITERLDVTCGTGITKPTRDLFLIIAYFAASVDGKVPDDRAAAVGRMKEVFEQQGAGGA